MCFLFSVGLPQANLQEDSPPSQVMAVTPEVGGVGGFKDLIFQFQKKKKIPVSKKILTSQTVSLSQGH